MRPPTHSPAGFVSPTRKGKADYKTEDEKQFYGSAIWKRTRAAHRQREPLCRTCRAQGYVTVGAMVDHIVAIRDGGHATDTANLQTLCNPCHQSKRNSERRIK